jgi:hypothetical protein
MSQENLEVVRLAYDVAYSQRSVEGFRHVAAENYAYHVRAEWPGRALYSLDEMPQLWADINNTFSEFSLVAEDFAVLGDEYVLVTIRQSFRMRGSDRRIESTAFHLWNVRDGKARETWVYGTREEALAAVGLRE